MPLEALDIPLVRQYWESGRTEGRTVGKAEGKAEGMADVLIHLLESRFGPLPEPVCARIRAASPEQMMDWSTAVLESDSLDQFLGIT